LDVCIKSRGLTLAVQLSLFLSTAANSSDKRFTGSRVTGESSYCADNLFRASTVLSAALDDLRKAAAPRLDVATSCIPQVPKDALLTPTALRPASNLSDGKQKYFMRSSLQFQFGGAAEV
jgi:hypothetical protein